MMLTDEQIPIKSFTVNANLFANPDDCIATTATFTVTNVKYVFGNLDALDMTFSEACTISSNTLTGQIHWRAEDTTTWLGPVNPAPATLWSPPTSFTAPTGNYMYAEEVVTGSTPSVVSTLLTADNATLAITQGGNRIELRAGNSAVSWDVQFSGSQLSPLVPAGYYGSYDYSAFVDVGSMPNPVLGGLSITQQPAKCTSTNGWFIVDKINYTLVAGVFQLSDLDLRYAQPCGDGMTTHYGKIHWSTPPTGAMTLTNTMSAGSVPLPGSGPTATYPSTNACQNAMAGVVIPVGTSGQTYIALDSQYGDYVGYSNSYCYTQADTQIAIAVSNGAINIGVTGNDSWTAAFPVTITNGQIQTGSYNTSAVWGGDGRGCEGTMNFNVINATYVNNSLNQLDMTFTQQCNNDVGVATGGPLNGTIHWWAGDPTAWPGPVYPAPPNLWQPMKNFAPPSGNYVYLEGTGGDYVTGGSIYLYTPDTMSFTVSQLAGNDISVVVGPNFPGIWQANFEGNKLGVQVQPGFYGNLMRYPTNNPVTGGISVMGNFNGCNSVYGWFIVDSIAYSVASGQNKITALDLRFEQYCDGDFSPMHGKIHWVAN